MKLRNNQAEAKLVDRTTARIRFSEVDSMQIVWHGVYVKYFEDGRESFGYKYGLSYMDVHAYGYMIPMVSLNLSYKIALAYEDEIIIETRYIPSEAAKIVFEYTVYRASDMAVAATGESVQVFIDGKDRSLELQKPAFYEEWQKKWGVCRS